MENTLRVSGVTLNSSLSPSFLSFCSICSCRICSACPPFLWQDFFLDKTSFFPFYKHKYGYEVKSSYHNMVVVVVNYKWLCNSFITQRVWPLLIFHLTSFSKCLYVLYFFLCFSRVFTIPHLCPLFLHATHFSRPSKIFFSSSSFLSCRAWNPKFLPIELITQQKELSSKIRLYRSWINFFNPFL